MKTLVTRIASEVNCPIDVHCHNDFGLAVANTIAAVEAGASQVQVTVNGLGERAGNADLAQTVMIMEAIYRHKDRDTKRTACRNLATGLPVLRHQHYSHSTGCRRECILT